MVKAEKFVQSKWGGMFEVLAQREVIYLEGNHDRLKWIAPVAVAFAAVTASNYQIQLAGKKLLIEHGHRILPGSNDKFPIKYVPRHRVFGSMAWYRDGLGVRLKGPDHFKQYLKHNQKIKAWVENHLGPDEILVTGHTHAAEFAIEEKYINDGCVNAGYASYLEINEDETLNLVQQSYSN